MQYEQATDIETTRLLLSVAEQLKIPLTTIARQAELSQLTEGQTPGQDHNQALRLIELQTTAALTLVDNYLLGLQLLRQESLELEPVSVSSVLVDVAHALTGLAQQHDVTLNVRIAGKYEPVMAHHQALKAALLSLGYALIGARAEQDQSIAGALTLAVHRTQQGITAGIYGTYDALTAANWRKAMQLYGTSRQPLTTLTADTGAGVFVADALSRAMESKLRVGRHARATGLALTLVPSRQLSFI